MNNYPVIVAGETSYIITFKLTKDDKYSGCHTGYDYDKMLEKYHYCKKNYVEVKFEEVITLFKKIDVE